MKALVTGASSGIGLAISKYFSELGYDLILVSRNVNKLESICHNFKTKVKLLEFDLSVEDNCYKLHEIVKKEKIDILVNNAGFGDAGVFWETNLNKELNMIDLNVRAYHILTKLFLKDFMKRDYGRILNVASMAGFMPGPYMATYYATKSYVVNLSLAISKELKDINSNVKISIFCPGPVETNFNNVANVKFNISSINSDYAAKYAVDNMFKNKLIIVPPNMRLSRVFTKIFPTNIVLNIESKVQERDK